SSRFSPMSRPAPGLTWGTARNSRRSEPPADHRKSPYSWALRPSEEYIQSDPVDSRSAARPGPAGTRAGRAALRQWSSPMMELDDEAYFDTADPDTKAISAEALDAPVAILMPAAPPCLRETAMVHEAVQAMLARRQAGVLIVDGEGRLSGIFTERDVLRRVVGAGRDVATTPLSAVMTPSPEALSAGQRVAYAVHCMSVAGYRTVPLADAERRPIGVVTVTDVIRWLAGLFPEAVLNLRPGDAIKHPERIDAG